MTQDPWAGLPSPSTFTTPVNSPEFIKKIEAEFDKELTPTTQLVFECCKCGVIHDPETISFQTLIDTGKVAGWTIKFRDAGYDAYCKDHSP